MGSHVGGLFASSLFALVLCSWKRGFTPSCVYHGLANGTFGDLSSRAADYSGARWTWLCDVMLYFVTCCLHTRHWVHIL